MWVEPSVASYSDAFSRARFSSDCCRFIWRDIEGGFADEDVATKVAMFFDKAFQANRSRAAKMIEHARRETYDILGTDRVVSK